MDASLIVAIIIALVVVYVYWLRVLAPKMAGIQFISLNEYRDHFKKQKHVLLDVRSASEYESGHIILAKNFPVDSAARSKRSDNESMIGGRPVVCVCASGTRAKSVATILARQGFEPVYAIKTGMMEWKRKGLPVQLGAEKTS